MFLILLYLTHLLNLLQPIDLRGTWKHEHLKDRHIIQTPSAVQDHNFVKGTSQPIVQMSREGFRGLVAITPNPEAARGSGVRVALNPYP